MVTSVLGCARARETFNTIEQALKLIAKSSQEARAAARGDKSTKVRGETDIMACLIPSRDIFFILLGSYCLPAECVGDVA